MRQGKAPATSTTAISMRLRSAARAAEVPPVHSTQSLATTSSPRSLPRQCTSRLRKSDPAESKSFAHVVGDVLDRVSGAPQTEEGRSKVKRLAHYTAELCREFDSDALPTQDQPSSARSTAGKKK